MKTIAYELDRVGSGSVLAYRYDKDSVIDAEPLVYKSEAEAALAEAVKKERETCALLCESLPDQHGVNEDGRAWLVRTTRAEYAAAIRARGDKC
jgi:hypothetical protein